MEGRCGSAASQRCTYQASLACAAGPTVTRKDPGLVWAHPLSYRRRYLVSLMAAAGPSRNRERIGGSCAAPPCTNGAALRLLRRLGTAPIPTRSQRTIGIWSMPVSPTATSTWQVSRQREFAEFVRARSGTRNEGDLCPPSACRPMCIRPRQRRPNAPRQSRPPRVPPQPVLRHGPGRSMARPSKRPTCRPSSPAPSHTDPLRTAPQAPGPHPAPTP